MRAPGFTRSEATLAPLGVERAGGFSRDCVIGVADF
jgi:hypothetical protein